MENKKLYKNLENPEEALLKFQKSFSIVQQNMQAVVMDYRNYMETDYIKSEINELRDSINYRLQATYVHFKIIIDLLASLNKELTNISRGGRAFNTLELHRHFYRRNIDISSFADSILFHLVSGFDYVSALISFVHGKKKKLKWVGLAKSARDVSNDFNQTELGEIIRDIDRKLVGKLYDHRSMIIHQKNENRPTSFSFDIIQEEVTAKIIASNEFTKKFSELRVESKTYELSLSYVMMWLMNQSVEAIIKIQFGIKDFIEQNKTKTAPFMFTKGPNSEKIPVSFWVYPE